METKIGKMFHYLQLQGKVTTQKELSEKIGISRGQLSQALNGHIKDERKLARMINSAYGSPFSTEWVENSTGEMFAVGDGSMQNVFGSNNSNGIATKNFDHEADWFALIAAKDKQIESLLTQQAEFLRLSSSLTRQNNLLIDRLTK